MKINYLNLKKLNNSVYKGSNNSFLKLLRAGVYIGGNEVCNFEKKYSNYVGAKYCSGVGNGLDAIYLALKALEILPGDEIIVPAHTFIATWLAVSNCGAVPIPIEPNIDTYNIDYKKIESSITKKTKAIIAVHLYGNPADLNPILKIAKKYNLYVIEDAAQAHGTIYKGKKIGSHSDIIAWSFYPGKNLGALGDAGAITTNNRKVYEKVKLISNYGSKIKYYNEIQGVNSRLDSFQAIILSEKLKYLNRWNLKKKKIAKFYLKEIVNKSIILPKKISIQESSWHIFPIRCLNRNVVFKKLLAAGIETAIHYPVPPHKQKAYYQTIKKFKNLTITENLSKELLSLPIDPGLTIENLKYIVNVLNKIKIP